ncbi:uncharacterized WD repeat-containing protein C2A9.03-like [Solanum pennellii]|uniref:Uncharacterized WD repeat-containing protein C2A9.03-like n=1 Tax=Solanum pennellii TaxID=28526 RepID=A0ABM1H8C8_SOLPN|nr:uncharacterized WD repeat-containing protein C2A9.03-like [Solanum pennellii]
MENVSAADVRSGAKDIQGIAKRTRGEFSGALHFIASYNDSGVKEFDVETLQLSNHFYFNLPVNHTSLSPDGNLLVIVGDDPEGMLVDSRSGVVVSSLSGHVASSYASAWHPDGQTFATGNQDNTCRTCPSQSTVLHDTFGPIMSIRYTSDGRYMAMAEHEDLVHIFDVKSGYVVEQEMDFFGEISGMSFSPDTESIFIGRVMTINLRYLRGIIVLNVFNNRMEDVSAADVRSGAKDIQGIPWYLRPTREQVRQRKLRYCRNSRRNTPQSGETSDKEHKTIKKDCLYDFRWYARSIRPSFYHLRLRNMVWATSKHDVYLLSAFSAVHWSSLTCTKTEILDFSGHVVPLEKHPKSFPEGFTVTLVSTLAVKDNLLLAGGLQGELIVKYLDKPGVSFCARPTYDAITTCIEINNSSSGALHFIASYNDSGVREFDMETFQLSNHFQFNLPVNHTSLSPDGNLLVIVGDDPEGMLVDSRSGVVVSSLSGHVGSSYASAWHPDGQTFATGNEDNTCRIWDIRNLSKSVTVLNDTFGPIMSIRYTSDGRYMAMAEYEDLVHIFDVKSGYVVEQEIDFFGEISGMSFSPDTESLFIGVSYSGLLEFRRRHNYSYLDTMI